MMPDHATNVIRRQFIDVDLHGTESDGMALQRRLADLSNRLMSPVLDRVLAQCDPRDGWVTVDRLDVDLGSMSLDDLERDLPDALGRAVQEFFRDNPPPDRAGATAGNVQHRTSRETADDVLVFFLRTGRLPWSFRLPPGRHLEEMLLSAWTVPDGSVRPPGPMRRAALLDAIGAGGARRRLVGQFSTVFLETLLRRLSESAAATVSTCLSWFDGIDRSLPARDLLLAPLWEAAFAALVSSVQPEPRELLSAAWAALPSDTPGHAEVGRLMAGQLPGVVGGAAEVMGASASGGRSVDRSRRDPGRTDPPATPLDGPGTEGGDSDDGVYVDNAGIVLLHPFLARCFDALGIAVGDRLRHPDRALSLLHYLATGASTAPEYELVLAKVLCDLPIDEPVAAVTLNDDETAEAVALIEAAIRHWAALRGTGPDGLRGTFLMRPGMLSRDEDGDWMLRVEAQTFDILLDQLPWGISMIQLPWMQHLLRVEWR